MKKENGLAIHPMNRPNFFPGMMVDFRDFNRLSQQSDKIVSQLCQYLFCKGGIIVDALEEFAIIPVPSELSVRIRPGIALLPNGQAVCLNEEVIIDLSAYQTKDALIVSLTHSVQGVDRFTDTSDPSISGFKTEIIKPEFVFSHKEAPANSIELFRVFLDKKTKSLRLAKSTEGWSNQALKGEDLEGILDLRYRPQIVPQTFFPVSAGVLIELREVFFQIEKAHQKIGKLYFINDSFHSLEYLTLAHAEILSRPFQPLKISFLISEFAIKFSQYLELLDRQLGEQKSRFDRDSLIRVIEYLAPFREKEVLPKWKSLDAFFVIAKELENFVNYGLANFHLVSTVEEALMAVQNLHLSYDSKVILAGQSFERVDLITREADEKWTVKTEESHSRSLTAQFENGDRLSLKGIFFSQGSISFDLNISDPSQIACLLMHQYFRRGQTELYYEVNGKPLKAKTALETKRPNSWINSGLVIPEGYLTAGKNRLKITVEKTDLDFGFFDLAVYQPKTQEEVKK